VRALAEQTVYDACAGRVGAVQLHWSLAGSVATTEVRDVTDAGLMVARWRPVFLYHCRWAARGRIGGGVAMVSVECIGLVLVSRDPGCKRCINIISSSYVVGAACCLLECGRFPQNIF
jgi:hypothetical protein